MRDWFVASRVSAGFIVVLVGYTSSAVIVFQAAAAAGASEQQISSWLWALGVGMGLSSIGLSWYSKKPILTAWSTPGAALLVTSLQGLSINEAIGAFLFSSLLITLSGLSGFIDKLIRWIPQSLASAMLAGVLLQFSLQLFSALESQLILVVAMIACYLIGRHIAPRYVMLLTLLVGCGVAYQLGLLDLSSVSFQLAKPEWVNPYFSWQALIGVGLPLFVVTMASQNMPGIAALHGNGYRPAISPIITWTGVTGLVLAPFGGFAFNLSAITASICMGKEADSDPSKRYLASIWAGIFYIAIGLLGATVVSLFAAFPQELVAAVAGLALLSTIANSLAGALADVEGREAAICTFLLTASSVSFFGIGSAFWGLSLGMLVHYFTQAVSKKKQLMKTETGGT
ncbi:benzoate/H(+) symporter BenE family transporter [Agarivorans sp. 1_MG-2023]|uniref:benzoate/H(+) symporter BenE family transporter n=1 Tax=Agarivorans sp. 1_MG-2023 TaxID=3062634 RepID=UPI0026E2675C|nr:benzoate/H(+) symporter BenE family transporter [Agarivorans sp. 1_MG-2023]MDO6762896.1 benzoate/H(+) symporter BenE family transporter [Agarivorans sp. 1_MG-2023]